MCADLTAVDYLEHIPDRPLPEGIAARALRSRRRSAQHGRGDARAHPRAGARRRAAHRRRCSRSIPASTRWSARSSTCSASSSTATPTSRASSCPRTGKATRCARTSRTSRVPVQFKAPEGDRDERRRSGHRPLEGRRRWTPAADVAVKALQEQGAASCACPKGVQLDPNDLSIESGEDQTMIINMGPQHPQHPRRAAPHARTRRRDRRAHQAGHRLPAHRHGEDGRDAHLHAGRHQRHAHGLPLAAAQRDGLLDGGRAAARHRSPRARRVDPHAARPSSTASARTCCSWPPTAWTSARCR